MDERIGRFALLLLLLMSVRARRAVVSALQEIGEL